MKEQITTSLSTSSQEWWDHLEEFARGHIQRWFQSLLEEEVTVRLGRKQAERRAAGRADAEPAPDATPPPPGSHDAMRDLAWPGPAEAEDGRATPWLEALGDGGEMARGLLQRLDGAGGGARPTAPGRRFPPSQVHAAWQAVYPRLTPAQRRVADRTIGPLLQQPPADGAAAGPALTRSRGRPALALDFRALAKELGVASHSRVWAHYHAVLAALNAQLKAGERDRPVGGGDAPGDRHAA